MSVTNYWKNYYLNTEGKLKRRKKTFVPKYLNKRSNSFNFGHSAVETPALNRPRGIFQGWNRSAYFRFKANKDSISKSAPNSAKPIIAPLKPLSLKKTHRLKIRVKSKLSSLTTIQILN